METSNTNDNKNKKQKKRPNRKANYIASIIVNTAVLIVLNLIPNWNIVFITESYRQILWAVNLSLGIQITGNAVLLFHHPLQLHHLFNAIYAIFIILSTAVILAVFPFNFSMVTGTWLTTLVKAVLICAIVGSGISVLVNFVQAATNVRR